MPMSEQAARRLADLGHTTDEQLVFWRWVWEEGESHFWSFFEHAEQAAAEYRRWFPRLQAFAADCRLAAPAPDPDLMSAAEREQARVLATKMREFFASEHRRGVLDRKPNQAVIVSTNRVGLAAAEELFAGAGAVVLTSDERDRWFDEVFTGAGNFAWWYTLAGCSLSEGLPEGEEDSLRVQYPVPPGSDYWVVTAGGGAGGLAGGGEQELWCWDGARAEFIAVCAVYTA